MDRHGYTWATGKDGSEGMKLEILDSITKASIFRAVKYGDRHVVAGGNPGMIYSSTFRGNPKAVHFGIRGTIKSCISVEEFLKNEEDQQSKIQKAQKQEI